MENYLTEITNYLLTQSWQIAVLVVVIAAVSLALKNKSAHVRYLLWLIVLAKCLVPPLLTVPLAILPQDKAPGPALISNVEMPAVNVETADTITSEPLALPSLEVTSPTMMERLARVTVRQWLGFGWIVGVAAFLLFASIKALHTNQWLRRQRKPLPAEMQDKIQELFSNLGIRTFTRVWLINGIGQPFVWGLLRGSIYLPANFVKVDSAEHRRGVLGHELSHILRFDAAVNILQIIAQAVFWFHPFVWWANKKIRAEREKCCDEMAIARLGVKAKDFSSAIVNILICEHESTRPVPSLAVAGPVKNIEERIKTMMRPGKKFHRRPSLVAAITVLVLALLIVPTALVLTARAETQTALKSLHQAAAAGDIEQVKSLISKSVDVNARDENTNTPLILAAMSGHKEVVELLLSKGADIEMNHKDGGTALHAAANHGYRDVAEVLIAKGANVNAIHGAGGWTPMHGAVQHGHYDVVEMLIDKGADINAKANWSGTPLEDATQFGSPEHQRIAQLLLEKGALSRSPIHTACYLGDVNSVKSSLETGTDVNTKDYSGRTPLHRAATAGQVSIAELLLAKGASVDASAGWNETPLHEASGQDHPDVAELLIAKGANLNVKDGDGDTPLHYASLRIYPVMNPGSVVVAKLLIQKGANINARNKSGQTPLQTAADCGFKNLVEVLLEKGADVNATDNEGKSPLSLAKEKGHEEIVELLRKHGAKEQN